jgi:hypothetical protein
MPYPFVNGSIVRRSTWDPVRAFSEAGSRLNSPLKKVSPLASGPKGVKRWFDAIANDPQISVGAGRTISAPMKR